VIDEAADHRVGLQARRWQRVVEDLGRSRLLHQDLAAPAGPLAANLALLRISANVTAGFGNVTDLGLGAGLRA